MSYRVTHVKTVLGTYDFSSQSPKIATFYQKNVRILKYHENLDFLGYCTSFTSKYVHNWKANLQKIWYTASNDWIFNSRYFICYLSYILLVLVILIRTHSFRAYPKSHFILNRWEFSELFSLSWAWLIIRDTRPKKQISSFGMSSILMSLDNETSRS